MRKKHYLKTAFVGGQLITGRHRPPVQDSLVIIENGGIIYAGERNYDMAPDLSGFDVVDITGKTVMPGLIDTHLHFSGNLNDNDSDWVREPLLQKQVMAVQQSRECLENGLTTVGEISRFGIPIRDMINSGQMQGPRVIASGRGFCATASHGDSHNCSIEEVAAGHPWAEAVDGPWELRKAVRRRLRECPDAIKIWATGGGIYRWDTSRDHHYTLEEIKAVVEEAGMRGIPVWSHTYGKTTPSVEAGTDFIIHGFEIDEADMEKMFEKGIYFCPTINFLPAWLSTYPPTYIPGVHDKYEGKTLIDKELARLYDNVNKAYRMGVIITVGSDSFNSDSTPYGITAIGEIHRFVDCCGMSEMDAIIAGTANGARALGCYHLTGSITRGKTADMIILNGDPLKSIYDINVDNMDMIIKDGEEVLRYRDKK